MCTVYVAYVVSHTTRSAYLRIKGLNKISSITLYTVYMLWGSRRRKKKRGEWRGETRGWSEKVRIRTNKCETGEVNVRNLRRNILSTRNER